MNLQLQTDEYVRIALAYNRLTTLPMAFALLSRLRYLVLRNNNFSTFPNIVGTLFNCLLRLHDLPLYAAYCHAVAGDPGHQP